VYFRRTPTRLAVGRKWVEKCFVGSQLSDSRQVHLDKWFTQLLHPEREWLSRFEAGILMIGKIKPTVAIRTELRLIFSESQSIECAIILGKPPRPPESIRLAASFHKSPLEALVD
jgi:hypothetical protein